MLIPRFALSQDSKTLTITLLAHHCKLGELDVEVNENCFLFSCWPYYLRLTLPGNIIDDEKTKAAYDTDTGEFTFCYTKAIEGEIFEDLDFITKFLVKKVDVSYGFEADDKKITMLSGDGVEEEGVACTDLSHILNSGFGFALLGGTHFKSLHTEYFDVFEVDPFKVNLQDRHILRMKNEGLKFNVDHYLCDLLEPDEIEEIIKQVAPWENLETSTLIFTNKELDFLKDLPNKVYNLSSIQINFLHNTLIDILYAYCYNQRTTYYEENSEAGWNVVKLSASLSWLDVFETPRETLVSSFRRSLIYPLYRNFNLSEKILVDMKKLLSLGEKFIIKCLIEIYYIFLNGDCCRYILNKLFIKDYINYVMKWDKNKWQEYLQDVFSIDIKKADLGLNLLDLEQHMLLEQPMAKLEIRDDDSDDSSETDETSETDTSDTDDISDDEGLDDSSRKANELNVGNKLHADV
ncbi:protein SHQ1 homolog [Anoplophora glabripennis]|uniref:protein SHQ1 homolog n=1 Tax=Anoplophora glabripennis TaxID=217634 RepID=UPI000875307C|nr:protein SHQ1 homolog [Anoplophora glabripennis]